MMHDWRRVRTLRLSKPHFISTGGTSYVSNAMNVFECVLCKTGRTAFVNVRAAKMRGKGAKR